MQIRDLIPWPPVFTGWGTRTSNYLTATIKHVQAEGNQVRLSVDDQGREYNTTIRLDDIALARRVALTLKNAIGNTVQDAGILEVAEPT